MAKKKSSKRSARKSVKRSSRNSPVSKSGMKSSMTKAGWTFVNLLLLVTFLYGIYVSWSEDWAQGLSIIVAVLLIIFFIRLYLKLKRK